MTRRRWIADEAEGDRAALTGAHAAHLARVLRARVGQEFDISIGDAVRRGRIASIGDDRVEFELGEMVQAEPERKIELLLAVFKFDRFEWAVEKCTELGVQRIVPVIARRTDAHLANAALKRVDRWERIAREAAQQSRRVAAPEIALPLKLKDVVTKAAGLRIVLSETEDDATLRELVERADADETATLAIGPEGGWTDDEEALFKERGWASASLGSTILRAETAAIAATAIVQAMRR